MLSSVRFSSVQFSFSSVGAHLSKIIFSADNSAACVLIGLVTSVVTHLITSLKIMSGSKTSRSSRRGKTGSYRSAIKDKMFIASAPPTKRRKKSSSLEIATDIGLSS